MSESPSPSAKTELETVVNWPLLVSAASVAVLLLAVPLVLACIAAFRGQTVQAPIASVPAVERPQPMKVEPTGTPARTSIRPIVQNETTVASAPRQVYVKGVQPPIPPDPTPRRTAIKTLPAPPSILNPVQQTREAAKPSYKRLDDLNESVLFYQLARTAREVDLEGVKGTRAKLLAEAGKDKDRKKPPILALREQRSDLKGLPMREGAECQARPEDVKKMQEISVLLRQAMGGFGRVRDSVESQHREMKRAHRLRGLYRTCEHWFEDDGISTLAQMLATEDSESRLEFLKRLNKVKSPKASVILARQALFDFSWPVREQAIKALKDRPRAEYRQELLAGLRYPWPPVAAHAAEALVALQDQEAIVPLIEMLDEPDPCAPVRDKNNKWVLSEVVRINHLRNCLLCHAVSTAQTDPLRSLVPTPGQPLPTAYYSRGKGDFVRADITYLRQDFSLMQFVDKPDKWPQWQRFDYLVRQRELKADELAALEKWRATKPDRSSYPQREAVRFALRELVGQDAGESSADWYETLCTLEP